MLKSLSSINREAFHIATVAAAIGLLASPWYLGYTAEPYATWHAWAVGVAVTAVAIATLFKFHLAEEWANLALGLWAVAAPWALGFSTVASAMWAHVIFGLAIAILAAVAAWNENDGSFLPV